MKFLVFFILVSMSLHAQTDLVERTTINRPDFFRNYETNDTIVKSQLIGKDGKAIFAHEIEAFDDVFVFRSNTYYHNLFLGSTEYIKLESQKWLLIVSDSNSTITSQGTLLQTDLFLPRNDTVSLTRPDPPYLTKQIVIRYWKTVKDGQWTFIDSHTKKRNTLIYKKGILVQ